MIAANNGHEKFCSVTGASSGMDVCSCASVSETSDFVSPARLSASVVTVSDRDADEVRMEPSKLLSDVSEDVGLL